MSAEKFDLEKEEHLSEAQKMQLRQAIETKVESPTEDELAFLKNPELLEIIDREFDKKICGEKENRRTLFLHTAKRLVVNLEHPDALIVNAESSTGKDFVSKRVTQIHPAEFVFATRLSPSAVKYWKAGDDSFTWEGKILRVVDASDKLLDSEDFKVFLSDDESAVVTNRDKRGSNQAIEYKTNGKPVTIITTAEANPKKEALNRVNILPLDETVEQTKGITRYKLRRAAGKDSEKIEYNPVLKSALSKLSRVEVVIPFAEKLENHLPQDIRVRRDLGKWLNYILASAALFQYQRERNESGQIIATKDDYEIARRALMRIQTGAFVSLTRGLKRTLEAAQAWGIERPESWFSVKDLWATAPICSERQLYNNIEELAERKLLEINSEIRPPSKKPISVYKAKPEKELRSVLLPKFEDLEKTSINSNYSNKSLVNFTSINSNTSIDGVN